MAGKAKSVYLTVTKIGSMKTEFTKMFFDAKSYNEYVNSEEFKSKWPATEYTIVKETYWYENSIYKRNHARRAV